MLIEFTIVWISSGDIIKSSIANGHCCRYFRPIKNEKKLYFIDKNTIKCIERYWF